VARFVENNIQKTMDNKIKELELMKSCKYLGVEEKHNTEYKNEKEKLKKEYVIRLKLVLNTELSAKNKMHASVWNTDKTSTKIQLRNY